MSATGRKNLSNKIEDAATPQDQKSYGQQAKETFTDGIDKRNLQPDQTKSSIQKLGDSIQFRHEEGKRDVSNTGNGIGDTAKEYLKSAKKTLNDAPKFVSGDIDGGSEGASDAGK